MDNAQMLAELKQYIDTSLSRALTNVVTKDDIANIATKDDIANMATKDDIVNMATKDDLRELREEMNERFTKVDDKLDEVMGAVGESLHHTIDAHDEQLDDHEKRIVRLEAHRV